MPIPVIVLLIVFILTATRKIGEIRLAIWQVMLGAALVVLVTGEISPAAAFAAVDWDVMLFLLGMFVIGQALEESGYLAAAAHRIFSWAHTPDAVILTVLFFAGGLSALLMNDTVAIIGTPVALIIARQRGINPTALLLTLAFAVTIGSAASPIGNPQNLIIAVSGGMENPFGAFLGTLAVPSIINLLIAYLFIRVYYRRTLAAPQPGDPEAHVVTDRGLSRAARASLILLAVLIAVKIGLTMFGAPFDFPLTAVALVGAVPVLLSAGRVRIVRNIDWGTLIFFASMFVFMQSVWDSGFFQGLTARMNLTVTSTDVILLVSILISQLISNVPLVALYLPVLLSAGAGTHQLVALGAGSTIAGNLFILGAASNVIIIQNAERRRGVTVTFWEFARIGVPLTIANTLVYRLFLG
jgi:Na+/H+ antiporter NhaD/arsenite permease-like protein